LDAAILSGKWCSILELAREIESTEEGCFRFEQSRVVLFGSSSSHDSIEERQMGEF